jgi:lipoyl-dependent peroxiredoxin
MKRSATSQWRGNLKQGIGYIRTASGSIVDTPYSFLKRFGDEPGTNPEELIAAAHSSCFAMAMSGVLEEKNVLAESIEVRASVTLEQNKKEWSVTGIHLDVAAYVPDSNYDTVLKAANTAKDNCPISRLLNTKITMNLNLVSHQESATF